MKNIAKYNTFIFISTFIRNIIDVYEVVYLYQKGFTIKEIIFIYAIVYFLGNFITHLCMTIGNEIGYKYILISSSIITSIAFYIIHRSSNIYLIALFLSLSMFTYHPIRHYYGIRLLKQKKEIGKTLILMYIASLLSSYIVIKSINIIYLIIISIISIIPIISIQKEKRTTIKYPSKINYHKLKFFFFDQFKITFILLEPLYLYIIVNDISYVGIFNIILTIASVVAFYLITRINLYKYYKYINIIFVIVLIIKLNIYNRNILLIIAFLEGVGVKINELVSTTNLYNQQKTNQGYIIMCEKFFCMIRALLLSIIYFLPFNLKTVLSFLIIGIFLLSFQYKKDTSI